MSKERTVSSAMFVQEIFSFNVYKRTQGRIARQVTCVAVWIAFALAAWALMTSLQATKIPAGKYVIPGVVLVAGLWVGYRLVNYPRFADFLIAVEAEMNKVSWPSRGELIRSSVVVIFVIFMLAIVLFGYDVLWQYLFKNVLGVLK